MGRAFELITGFVIAPSTTQTGLTLATGNSLTVRNFEAGKAWLFNTWTDVQGAGILRIFSPRMHDGVNGLRLQSATANPRPLMPTGVPTPLESQDTLTVDLSGSATAGDIESASLLVMYENLPGVEGRFITESELRDRGRQMMAVQNTIATGTGGGYTGEEAINADFDNLKANRDYAILGYVVSAECCSVRWRGTDFGNLGVGGPGSAVNKDITSRWFVWLARQYQTAAIPVFNASNKAGLLIDAVQDENGTDVVVSTICMELN